MFCTQWVIMELVGIKIQKKIISDKEIDYSYYLGPNFKNEKSTLGERGRVSKTIAPHSSCFDILALISVFDGDLSWVANDFIK